MSAKRIKVIGTVIGGVLTARVVDTTTGEEVPGYIIDYPEQPQGCLVRVTMPASGTITVVPKERARQL